VDVGEGGMLEQRTFIRKNLHAKYWMIVEGHGRFASPGEYLLRNMNVNDQNLVYEG
jgi:hypothetical protein